MIAKKLNGKIILLVVLAGLASFISLDTLINYDTSVYMNDDVTVTKKPNPTKQKPTPTITPMPT